MRPPGEAVDRPDHAPDLLRALADPRRRRIVEALAARSQAASALARRLDLPPAGVGYHLRVLAAAGLVRLARGEAAVRPEALRELRRYVDEALTAAAVGSDQRLP